MTAPKQASQTAFVGDLQDFARLVAAEMLPAITATLKVEPPMDIAEAAQWLGVSTSHLRQLVAHRAVPFHDYALPGSDRQMVRFFKHELAMAGECVFASK